MAPTTLPDARDVVKNPKAPQVAQDTLHNCTKEHTLALNGQPYKPNERRMGTLLTGAYGHLDMQEKAQNQLSEPRSYRERLQRQEKDSKDPSWDMGV